MTRFTVPNAFTRLLAPLLVLVLLVATTAAAQEDQGHDGEHGDDHAHQHGTVEAPSGITVSLDVSQDPMSGYNVHIVTTGLTWAPERASREHLAGEGHAHLYVNGEKVARVYGPWYHLGDLPGGEAEVRVTLNTNTHDDYAHDGVVVADSVTVMASDVAEGVPDDHDHEHDDEHDHEIDDDHEHDHELDDDHGHDAEHAHGDAVMGSRLIVSDANAPTVAVLDLASGEVIARFDTPGAAGRVHQIAGSRHALVTHRAENRISVIRTGLRVSDHGDHQDLIQEAPYVAATMNVGRQPTHVFAHGDDIAIFNDADGTVAVLDRRLLGLTFASDEIVAAQPDHGAVLTLADHVLVGYLELGRVDVYRRDGERIDSFEGCPGLHGEAVLGATAAFGCADGVLLVRASGGVFTAEKIGNPPRSPENARVGTLTAHEGAGAFVGNFGEGLLRIDVETSSVVAIELPAPPLGMVFEDAEQLLVLTGDGELLRLDADSGVIRTRLSVVETHGDDDGGHGATRPSLAVAPGGGHAYVSDPHHREVHEIHLAEFERERSVSLPMTPASFAVAAIPGATVHESYDAAAGDGHDHGDDDDGHDHDDDYDHGDGDGHDHGDDHDHDHGE